MFIFYFYDLFFCYFFYFEDVINFNGNCNVECDICLYDFKIFLFVFLKDVDFGEILVCNVKFVIFVFFSVEGVLKWVWILFG